MEGENNQTTGEQRDSDGYKVGPGKPPLDKQFTAANQPTPEAKATGQKRAKFNRDIIRKMLQEPLQMDWASDDGKALIAKYGAKVKKLPAGVVMTQAQMVKALNDTYAFNSVTDQGLGRPVQAIAQTNAAGEDLPQIYVGVPLGLQFNLPSNTEGTDKKED